MEIARLPHFSLAGEPASKREQKSGMGLELDVNGIEINTPSTLNSKPTLSGLELNGMPVQRHWANNPVQTVPLMENGEKLIISKLADQFAAQYNIVLPKQFKKSCALPTQENINWCYYYLEIIYTINTKLNSYANTYNPANITKITEIKQMLYNVTQDFYTYLYNLPNCNVLETICVNWAPKSKQKYQILIKLSNQVATCWKKDSPYKLVKKRKSNCDAAIFMTCQC